VKEPPEKPAKPSRRAILTYVHADENERTVCATAVETLDGMPVQILLGVADESALVDAEAWVLGEALGPEAVWHHWVS
jgi:hypothetical protein